MVETLGIIAAVFLVVQTAALLARVSSLARTFVVRVDLARTSS